MAGPGPGGGGTEKKEEGIAMRLLKQAVTMLGAVMIVAVLVAVVAPKRVQAVVATLVQIVPGSTTHLGQNESQIVTLGCYGPNFYCVEESTSTGLVCCGGTTYVVPAGYTLIVTDYSWISNGGYVAQGTYACDLILAGQSSSTLYEYASSHTCGLADATGTVAKDTHFTTGVRIPSGSTLSDYLSFENKGESSLQGYLVPN
jgi:hypothetical protein